MKSVITGVDGIDGLDLEPMKKKLMSKEDPGSIFSGWSRSYVDEVGELYKSFLYLVYKYGKCKRPLVPTRIIDEFWHAHILQTKKYHSDCQMIFGEYLHHSLPSEEEPMSTDDLEYTRFLISQEFPWMASADGKL